jgi:hypothetical protein
MENPALHRDLSGNQVKNGFARYQVGAGIGGALVKNKTFIISTLNILLILKIIYCVPIRHYRDRERHEYLIIFHQKLIKFGILISTRPCVQTWV